MAEHLSLANRLHDWLSEVDERLEIQALLKLPGLDWVKVIEFAHDGDVITLTYRGLSMSGYLAGDVQLVCPTSALGAIRKKESEEFDDDVSAEIAGAMADAIRLGKLDP